MRKSVVFSFLIASFISSLPAGAAPLHVREAAATISASAAAVDPVCSLDGSITRAQNRATPSWSNALADASALKLFRADNRLVAPTDKVTAQTLLPPELPSADGRWLSADASDRENANANAAVNHLFAPPNGMSLFVTQTNNERPRGAGEPNATLAAVQLLIH